MRDLVLKLQMKLQVLLSNEQGQDLVEYSLVIALIAFGAVTAMGTLATEINAGFYLISSDLATSL
jgi:pilus assembly protein Flp/PilA